MMRAGVSRRQLDTTRFRLPAMRWGHNTPPIAYLVKFCEHYRVSADYVLGLPRGLEWPRG